MHIGLFRALKAINVHDEDALSVVDGIEAHVESVVNSNIKAVQGDIAMMERKIEAKFTALEGNLTGVQASLDALRTQVQFVGVMIGIVGLAIAAGPIVGRFLR